MKNRTNKIYLITLSVLILFLFGCASIVNSEVDKERDPNYVLDRSIVQKADEELALGNLKRAEELYSSIVDQNQKSRFFLYANFGLAQVYLKQSRYDHSVNVLSEVVAASRFTLPDLALKSLVMQSEAFEEKKDFSRALLCLLDAEKIVPEDEAFVSLFIVPLRLALLYEKLNQKDNSKIYFQKAQMNFQRIEIPADVIEKQNLTRKVFELYEQSIEKFKDETVNFDIQLYQHQKKFMIFVLQMNEAFYSKKTALVFERKNFNLRDSILEFSSKKDLDVEARRRDLFERQYRAFLLYQGELQSLINEFRILTNKSEAVKAVLELAEKLNLQLKLDLEMRRPFNPKAEKDFSDVKEGGNND